VLPVLTNYDSGSQNRRLLCNADLIQLSLLWHVICDSENLCIDLIFKTYGRSQTAVTVAGEAAGQAERYIEGAQPTISSTLEKIVSSDPLVLATGVGALLILYFLAPPLLSSVAYSFRGFKGKFSIAIVAVKSVIWSRTLCLRDLQPEYMNSHVL